MGTIKFSGLNNYVKKLTVLEAASDDVIQKALRDGAGVAADEMRKAIEELPTSDYLSKSGESRPWWGTAQHPARGPTEEQKKGLLDSLGITSISVDEKGIVNIKIGFDGYNSVKSKQFPNGEPNLLIARAVNSGTSFMEACPFAKGARLSGGPKARKAMKKTYESEVKRINAKS